MKIRNGARILVLATLAVPSAALAQMGGMNMAMPMKPAHFAATHEAYTTNGAFLVKLISVPNPIPYEKYFALRFAVFDGKDPARRLSDAQVSVNVGMRHGLKTGFMHGMQSTPQVHETAGVFTVSGMYFHMMGPWTLETTVRSGGRSGVADFQLPCCAQ